MEVKNKYDNPDMVKARKDQQDPWVMYLIVRKSLGMSGGKIAAQVGHAVGILYSNYIQDHKDIDVLIGSIKNIDTISIIDNNKLLKVSSFEKWQKDSFRKIVLQANDSQWDRLKDQLECYIVRDAGLTEVDPGTETVIGLWPLRKSQRPAILKRLQLLK